MLFHAKIRCCQMEIKSHLFEIIQFCFLHSILLFLCLSVLLKHDFLYNKKIKKEGEERISGFLMHCHIYLQTFSPFHICKPTQVLYFKTDLYIDTSSVWAISSLPGDSVAL